ncbi:hypothetical protein DPMN_036550 [Dreissena polymorpha]|uniref:Uncharacterized protein n=2 Tax=Dreissena polymorpha TaxID=45954 RepID=A0A9D4MB29_DREPO|nr:hypothetical protein DPMN_036550 [Dreissena polymorpha]
MTTGEISQINVQKSIVNCKKNFTYTEAEAIVHDPLAVEDYLKSCVFVLFEIANLWRQKRLGNAALSTENIVNKATLLSHQLVEEMVIMAEVHVASVLTSKIPQAVPILVQPPPVSQHLEEWKGEHAADAINSIALTKPFLNLAQLEVCNCSLACIHSVNYVRQFNISKRDQVHVISILWDSLNDAVAMGDNGAMMNIIATAENHPQIAVALTKLRNIQEDPKYVICSDVPGEQQLHYELNRKQYVTFTNPLSCYMDIVVQRILLATLDNQPCPYKKQELKAICDHVNVSMGRCRSYEKEYFAVQLGAALLSKPLIVQPFVIGLNPHHVEVCFPMLPCFTDVQKIDLALLGICATPEVTPDGQLILKWQERVYDCDVLRNQAPVGSNIGELNPDRFIYMIPAYHWQRLLIAIRELDPSMRLEKLRSAVSLVGKQVSNPAHAENNQYIDDVTCEGSKLGNPLHFAEFSLRLHASQVLLMQLSARLNNSILTPYIQLVSLTNTLDICLQHRENPLECFITLDSSISAPLKPCPDINTYQKLWSAVAEIEAVTRAVEHNETVTIDNVLLDWKQQASNYVADLILPSTFLKQRGIKITSSVQELMLFSPKNSTYCSAYFSDFMCVRYSNIDFPDKSGLCDELSRIVNNRCSVTWVGHCKVVGVISINEKIVFKLQLVQSDVPLPLQLLHRRSCSVEIIHRTNQDRLILYALKNLDNCSQLAKDIILRQAPSAPVETSDVTLLLQSCKQVFPGTNGQQDEAMKHALSQPLTMIQGCVGSGKSLLAAILGLAYCKRNQTCRQQAQVLVCAPTEASVDVIYDFFQSLGGSNANIVRVYGNAVEQVLHPGPKLSRRPCPSWDKENILKMSGRYAQRSLYSLVRQDGTRYGSKINEYESLFSLYPEDISVEDNDSYMQIVGRAEAAVLSEADIILCTCITSGQPELAACINIHQIIIDDANAGSELEILVPLSVYKDTENVALLGDINQMGPSVGSKIAQELGLGVSIMQSYMSTAVYLNVHYRVHEGIMDFPVKYGYTRATCGIISQRQPSVLNWTGGRNKPSAFCKLDGLEASIPLKYSCPLGETIVNMEQANFAVRVAMALVSSYNVNGSNICIISFTQAQCRNIERLLSVSATKSKIQCMGIKEVQGLEFDYVILSTVRSIPAIRVERYCTRKWLQENLGLLTNQGLVMSALTRARKGLVIVGNENLLCCSPMWRQLVGEYQQSNRLVAAEVFLQTMSL